jgi:hypothetical protein
MANELLIELARRFEPILYFRRTENYFPSDAKRYVEHCALWKAERPYADKDSWGGKGQPFPRQPMIEHQKIAVFEHEVGPGGTWLGKKTGTVFPFLTVNSDETRFLELAEWDNSDPTVIAILTEGVTSSSKNLSAALGEVRSLYFKEGTPLKKSQFWYHAELYDTPRLRELMNQERSPATPDLFELFTELVDKNPILLCYYLFFPGHSESLQEGVCKTSSVGAGYGSFAGEWACIAVLLTRKAASEKYMPAWIGHTTRRNVGANQGIDFQLRIGMSVTRWQHQTDLHQDPFPRTIGDHPKLYVALDTHSLYLDQGSHQVTPYRPEEAPKWCGTFDTPDGLDDHLKSRPEKKSSAAAWGKIYGGLALGGLWGLVAGAALTAMEGLPLGEGLNVTGQAKETATMTEQGPEPGWFGKVIHPAGVTVTDAPGGDPVPWASKEIEESDGRLYSYIVDRATQLIWPSDDGKSGYRGYWGPFVTNDVLHRRVGMLFPEFWRMFFVALAKELSK